MIIRNSEFDINKVKKSIEAIGFKPSVIDSKLFVNGFEIPYSSLKWVFERYGSIRVDKGNSSSFKAPVIYDIKIGSSIYSYKREHLLSADIFLRNGKPHSLNGPAKKSGSLEIYMKNGDLHRLDGPALISTTGKEVYAFDGKIYSLINAIPKFLDTNKSIVKHNGRKVHISFWKDYKHIRIGNHRWLLKKNKNKTQEESNRQFLLSALYKEQINYDIVNYIAPNQVYEDLDVVVKNLAKDAVIANSSLGHRSFSNTFDGERINISVDLNNNKMSYTHFTKDGKTSGVLEERLDGVIEAKEDMSKINVDALKDIEKLLGGLFESDSSHVYGVNVPEEIFKKTLYNFKDKSYCWKDENNKLHCPDEKLPSKIYPDGTMEFHEHGKLHRTNGPAIENVLDQNIRQYYIHGRKLSLDEYVRYSNKKNKVSFTKNGVLHREDGPALIDFNFDPPKEEVWKNGIRLQNEYKPMIDESIESSKEDGWVIKKEEEPKVMKDKDILGYEYLEDSPPKESPELYAENENPEEGRVRQILSGIGTGYKKGFVDGSTEMLAKKIAEMSPIDANQELASKIFQIILLMLSAETVNAVPEDLLNKANIDKDQQQDLVTFLHSLSGEKIGRNLTKLTTELVLPHLKDFITSFSLEEMVELAEEYEAKNEEQDEVTLEELINNSKEQVEQVVEQEEVEEVVHAVK